jgi:hypothetical protein
VTNSDSVISLAKEYSNTHRIFPLGIGKDMNRHLLTGIALNSNAHSEIPLYHPSVDAAVAKILQYVNEHYYTKAVMKINEKEVEVNDDFRSNNFNLFVNKLPRKGLSVFTMGVTYFNELVEENVSWTRANTDGIQFYDYFNLMKVELLRSWHATLLMKRLDKDNHRHQNTNHIIDLSISYRIMS